MIAQQVSYTMLVEALRLHAAEGIKRDAGWLAALADGRLRAALSCMHQELARSWTLADLAHAAGMSRTAFAQLFREKVGQPPIGYMSHRRLTVAARMLQDPNESVSLVASKVGYNSESAFSAAFKRKWGRTPREHMRNERDQSRTGRE